ncbi:MULTISPECIES: hypothetical protein [Flavobacterium]|nr:MULTISPECIES: hypothetical protein [Flavobacterium]MDQ7961954.1 hypothetical protein [Flavobacterium lindanitolerans]
MSFVVISVLGVTFSFSGCFSIIGMGSATIGAVPTSMISGDLTGISSTLP